MKIQILTVLLVVSVVLVGWIELNWFPYIPSNLSNANTLNSLIVNFSLAYITSYFFYYLVVYLKEKKDRVNSIEFVIQNCTRVIALAKAFKEKIEETGNTKIGDFPTADELNKILPLVKLDDQVKNHRRLYNLTWENYLKEISNESRYPIDRILGLIPYLDSDLVRILNKIYDSNFIALPLKIASSKLLSATNIPINMSMYSSMIEEYFKLLIELQDYVKENKKIDRLR